MNECRRTYLGRSYRHIEVAPLNATIGAEISGVQIADLQDADFAEIEQAFADYKVIFFGDKTYKLPSGTTSEPGRYVKSLGKPRDGALVAFGNLANKRD